MMLTLHEIIEATGGRLLFGKPNGAEGISIDSRTVREGELFLAIRGARFDGHEFLGEALAKASGAIVSIPPVNPPHGKVIVHVPDTLAALHHIARFIRRKHAPRVVGITGTNGKTTTKEMTAAILSRSRTVLKTGGNLNNQVGLPLSLLKLEHGHEAAVLEMGASGPGDIAELCAIAEPNVGVITNVGMAHLERFRDLTVVRATKMEILQSVEVGVVNADDAFLMDGLAGHTGRLVRVGTAAGADVRASQMEFSGSAVSFEMDYAGAGARVRLRVGGGFNVMNALAAAGAALAMGCPVSDVKAGLEEFKGVPMRLELKALCGGTLISDVYNANPASMEEAVKELMRIARGRTVAVLGDMLELGPYAETAHRRLGAWMAEMKAGILIAVGPHMALAAEEFEAGGGRAIRVADSAEARDALFDICDSGDTILVKGSRGMRMEEVVRDAGPFAASATAREVA
jgi:UDP-N-acetylmuramoyl-tripeptide--D-alanyl-D-alanine ligase